MVEKEEKLIDLNRYSTAKQSTLTKSHIDTVKKFLAGTIKNAQLPKWAKRYEKHLSLKDDNVYLDDRRVVADEERDDLMRELVYGKDQDVAPSRDAGYYLIKQRYLNISRRDWVAFLKKQRVIRQTDNVPPQKKRGGKKLNKKGELELDLFFIQPKDLPKQLRNTQNLIPVLVMVDRLTSLCFVKRTKSKEMARVGPVMTEAFNFFAKRLNIAKEKLVCYSDAGTEFGKAYFTKNKVKHVIVDSGSKVEKKNSDIQRVFHRLKNAKRVSSVTDGLEQATKIVNNSYNRVIKMSPNEAAIKYSDPDETKKLILEYNKHREKADTDRRKPLKVGDQVRVVLKSAKESSTFYKAYRGKQYTKEGHPVNDGNKGMFKDKDISKERYEVVEVKGSNPTRYKIKDWFKNGGTKWFTRDRLSEPTPAPDMKSEALLKSRGKKKKKKKGKEPDINKQHAKEHKTKPTAAPSSKAIVHVFKDDAEADMEGEDVQKTVRKYIKTFDSIPKKLFKKMEVRLTDLINYWDHKYLTVKGMLRQNFKDARNSYKGMLKGLKKIATF